MLGRVAAADHAGQDRLTPSPLGSLVDVGGYRVHLYCMGAGSPTVVVAGGAFSFDWGLVQPEAAKFTRICTYDPSGTAWSDPYPDTPDHPVPRCTERVAEIHQLLQKAGVPGPYVLVGFSIGGLIGRLYAHDYPAEVSGMVIVDHAFIDVGTDVSPQPAVPSKAASGDSPPVLISSTPITLGLEDDRNFQKLPRQNQDLHTWAMSIRPLRPTAEMAAECFAAVEAATRNEPYPLRTRPLLIISTRNDTPGYQRLQAGLAQLSRNHKQMVAGNSTHMVIIDQPELIVNAIREVVEAVRHGTALK